MIQTSWKSVTTGRLQIHVEIKPQVWPADTTRIWIVHVCSDVFFLLVLIFVQFLSSLWVAAAVRRGGRCLAMWLCCHNHTHTHTYTRSIRVIFEKQREKCVKPIMRRRDATHGVRSQRALAEIASLSLRSSPALVSTRRAHHKPWATRWLD